VILVAVFDDSSRFTPAATALVLSPLQIPAARDVTDHGTIPRLLYVSTS